MQMFHATGEDDCLLKRFVFILRDPGAYAAIYPVFLYLQNSNSCQLFCFDTAAKMNGKFAISENAAIQWIEKHISDIDVLILGTGFHTETEIMLMECCKQYGICTVAILDYWSNYKTRFAFRGAFMWPDIYVVMDKIAEQEAVVDGVPKSIIEVLGHPGLDEVLSKRKALQMQKEEGYVLLLGEPMSGRIALGYDEEKFFSDCVDILTTLGKRFSIKFHPRDDAELQRKYSTYRVDGDLLDIASRQDVVIGMTTIALLHCSLLGKKTGSYQPGLVCEDGCISNKLGLSSLITSREELLSFLLEPGFDCKMRQRDLIWMDGKSTERIACFLENL